MPANLLTQQQKCDTIQHSKGGNVERYNKFYSLISSISKSIQKIKSEEMATLGLKGKQVQCLYHLFNEEEGISMLQLCRVCGEDKGAMSRTISELEKGDFLYVEEAKTQKYRNPIKLTSRGKEVGAFINNKINEMFAIGSEGVKEEDREKFYENLSIVDKNLKEICENYGGKND